MTYSLVSDIRREFKSVLEEGTVMTDDKIIEFQLQNFSLINAYIGARYQVPVVGTAPVNQQDTVSFTPASGAGEVKSIKPTASGVTRIYSYTTVGADNELLQATALAAAINTDKNRSVDAEVVGNTLVLTSRVVGYAYTLVVVGTGVSFVNTAVADLGSDPIRLLRKIETELTACKIVGVLKTKVADKLQAATGVRQDIKDESCGKLALSTLKDIADGKIKFDVLLTAVDGGLGSSEYAGTYEVNKRQW